MSILEQIKSELPWLDDKVIFDLTRGKPSPDQLSVTEENFRSINVPYEMDFLICLGSVVNKAIMEE